VPKLRQSLGPVRDRLEEALDRFAEAAAPPGLEAFHEQLALGGGEARDALALFLDPGPPQEATLRVLGSLRRHCRAQEQLYPLRTVLPPLGRHFAEPACHERLADLDPDPPPVCGAGVGLHRAGEDPEARGGFSLYVPEWLAGDEPRALVVALHGGSGHGRDFLWTWLREARSRGFLLLAPTSIGSTWSLDAPARDSVRLRSMLEWVSARWPVDPARILLTGLSDGATFALLAGLEEEAPYTALAPVSGVLHPLNFASGNLARAGGRRIYLAHGALDWLFPVALARLAREQLEGAGAALVYREIEDLSHAYPREENGRILAWFDPSLDTSAG
jgi:phospholipase/carboxylesterase